MILPVLLLLAQDAGTVDAAVAAYREKTRADLPCRKPGDESEIVACGRREADRYRPPLVPAYNGREAARVREARLLDTNPLPCGQGAFLVQCGGVGVGVSVGGRGVRYVRRPLAP